MSAMAFSAAPPLPDFLASELPFTRRAYTLERGRHAGKRIHLLDHGPREARPLLLLHGNPTWSFLWRKVIPLLPEMRCVAPDLLGLGLSDKLPHLADHSAEGHMDALAELVEALDLRGVVLLGQDWGGPMATGVGARLPERVAGVVLGNTSVLVPRRPRGTAFHRLAHTRGVSDLLFRVAGFPLRSLHKTQGDPSSIQGQVARAYRWPLRRMRNRIAPLALARMVPNSPQHPSVAQLSRGEAWLKGFGGPLALVWGTRDPILGRVLGRHREAFPQARVTETLAGHFLQEEVPEEIAEAVRWVVGEIESGA